VTKFIAAEPRPDATLLERATADEILPASEPALLLAGIEGLRCQLDSVLAAIDEMMQEVDVIKVRLSLIYKEVRPYQAPADTVERPWK
jgi:hypothetical protein